MIAFAERLRWAYEIVDVKAALLRGRRGGRCSDDGRRWGAFRGRRCRIFWWAGRRERTGRRWQTARRAGADQLLLKELLHGEHLSRRVGREDAASGRRWNEGIDHSMRSRWEVCAGEERRHHRREQERRSADLVLELMTDRLQPVQRVDGRLWLRTVVSGRCR